MYTRWVGTQGYSLGNRRGGPEAHAEKSQHSRPGALERSACKASSWLASGNLTSKQFLPDIKSLNEKGG